MLLFILPPLLKVYLFTRYLCIFSLFLRLAKKILLFQGFSLAISKIFIWSHWTEHTKPPRIIFDLTSCLVAPARVAVAVVAAAAAAAVAAAVAPFALAALVLCLRLSSLRGALGPLIRSSLIPTA